MGLRIFPIGSANRFKFVVSHITFMASSSSKRKRHYPESDTHVGDGGGEARPKKRDKAHSPTKETVPLPPVSRLYRCQLIKPQLTLQLC